MHLEQRCKKKKKNNNNNAQLGPFTISYQKTHFKTNLNYHESKILFFTSNLLSKFPHIIAGEAFNMVLPEADLGLLQHPRWSSL